ncbi:ubiquitin thioesterase OTUB1 isoform X1 [Kryptolebias marmoratus]|uniref:ubiquitin thioesterase OTUB1 isoform X1 n=1 Tax=Kryptolebias marmoratus TaxID=37003 RepID=UPI0007F91783|nr:ubiquitin thioesterase OTUB1 isoform X1 [Kryptolebias marmoratus]
MWSTHTDFRKHPLFFFRKWNRDVSTRCLPLPLKYEDGRRRPRFTQRGHLRAVPCGNAERQTQRSEQPVLRGQEGERRWKLLLQSLLLRTPGVGFAQTQSSAEVSYRHRRPETAQHDQHDQQQDLQVIHVVEECLADEQESTLFRLFNEQLISDGVVQYLRLLTSAHLQNQADFFCNFVEAPDIKVYCRQEVEVMTMECDHVDILALSQALDVSIHIVSMEGDEQLAHHIIPEGAEPSLHLVYQSSHYNILYQRTPL